MLTTSLSNTRSVDWSGTTSGSGPARVRDVRLDVFRGLGMVIILIAHIPYNDWTLWIPGRFGFSDATEIFVFLSGMASAIAFGAVFDDRGMALGTARVAHRVWQVYWAHLCLFLCIAALMAVAGDYDEHETYLQRLNIQYFFMDTGPQLAGLVTLRYVPNFFDVLPMYLVILALLPIVMWLSRIDVRLAFVAILLTWVIAQTGRLDLPAEPWSDRRWFFNPFAWQLVFFTGFFLRRGALPCPPVNRALIVCAILIVVATIPIAWFRAQAAVPVLHEVAQTLAPLTDKTHFGALRFVHFLALAYLAFLFAGEAGCRLRGPAARVLARVGQQSLAVFLASMLIAQLLGLALDRAGRDLVTTAVANGVGIAAIIAVAYVAGWFKSAPWKARA